MATSVTSTDAATATTSASASTSANTGRRGLEAGGSRDALAGTATLVRFILRRDRVKLPAWVGGVGLFGLYVSTAIPAAYPTEQDLADVTGLFGDPVGRLMIGPGYGLTDPTHERLIGNGYGLWLMLVAVLMSILLVTRHTRFEEQSGRAELVRANVVGPQAGLTACLIVAAIANVAAGLLTFAVLSGVGGFAPTGSLLVGAMVAGGGLAFAAVTAVTVQLSSYSRGAAGLSGAVVGAAFLVRAGGDMAREGGNALSWTSPLAWGQQTAPYVLDRWWPLALYLPLVVVLVGVAYALSARRDLGASMFITRLGRARAHPRLGTPWGLAARLQRGSIIGWTVALAVTGFVNGIYADSLLAADDLPEVFSDLFGEADILGGYVAYMSQFMAYLMAAYAILAVQGLRSDESGGRGEPVLAAPVGRSTWLGANLGVTAIAVVVMGVLIGAASGIGAAIVTSDASYVGEFTIAQLNQVPAAWVALGLAVLLFGVLPRAIPVAWVVVVYGIIVGIFGTLLDLPQFVLQLSPFGHPAPYPVESVRPLPLVLLVVIAASLAAAGLIAFRRRDLDVK